MPKGIYERTEEHKEKMTNQVLSYSFKKGHIPWNDGLDKSRTKVCPKCKELKLRSEFYRTSRGNGEKRTNSYCKSCCAIKDKARDRTAYWRSEHYRSLNREKNREARKQSIQHYGGRCTCCGENRYEFLTFHHMNGNGTQHRKEMKSCQIGQWLRANEYPQEYEILCWNCHQSIENYKFCPHKKEVI